MNILNKKCLEKFYIINFYKYSISIWSGLKTKTINLQDRKRHPLFSLFTKETIPIEIIFVIIMDYILL